jgi:hypothetical protein
LRSSAPAIVAKIADNLTMPEGDLIGGSKNSYVAKTGANACAF